MALRKITIEVLVDDEPLLEAYKDTMGPDVDFVVALNAELGVMREHGVYNEFWWTTERMGPDGQWIPVNSERPKTEF